MPQHTITLESPWNRIRLVPPCAANDEEYGYCRSHPRTLRYLRILPETMTAEEARLHREKRAEEVDRIDFHINYIQEDGTTLFAGFCGYFHILEQHLSCESGVIVHPDLHGKNIATEALYVLLKHIFEERKLHRVTFMTASENSDMRGWLEKVAGARLEGKFKEAWREIGGDYVDAALYAILEGEWQKAVKKKLEDRIIASTSKEKTIG